MLAWAKKRRPRRAIVYWSAGSNGEMSFGVTVVVAPTAASSRWARCSLTAWPASAGVSLNTLLSPRTPRRRIARFRATSTKTPHDVARVLYDTPAFDQSRRERRHVELPFAYPNREIVRRRADKRFNGVALFRGHHLIRYAVRRRRRVKLAERRTLTGSIIAGKRQYRSALSVVANKGGSLGSASPDCLSDATRNREEAWVWGGPTSRAA